MKAGFKINCCGSNHLMAIPKGIPTATEGTVGKGPYNNVPLIPNTPKECASLYSHGEYCWVQC